MDRSLIDLLAQVAIIEAGQDSLLGGVHDDDGIRCFLASALGIFLALGDIGIAESGKVFFLVHPYHSIVHSLLQLVAPLLLQVRDAQVDLLHAFHLIVGQQGALAYELLISLFRELLIFAFQCSILLVVHLTDTLEESFVECNLVSQVGQHWHHFLLYLTNLGCLVGFCQSEERTTDAVEQFSTLFVGQNGVLESGRVGVIGNSLDLVA